MTKTHPNEYQIQYRKRSEFNILQHLQHQKRQARQRFQGRTWYRIYWQYAPTLQNAQAFDWSNPKY